MSPVDALPLPAHPAPAMLSPSTTDLRSLPPVGSYVFVTGITPAGYNGSDGSDVATASTSVNTLSRPAPARTPASNGLFRPTARPLQLRCLGLQSPAFTRFRHEKPQAARDAVRTARYLLATTTSALRHGWS